jgi:hypothetical protein
LLEDEMVKLERVKAGDVLYDCHRRKCGNTTISELGVWKVVVKSVDHSNMQAIVLWNGNQEQVYYAWQFRKLSRFPPEWVKPGLGEAKCHMCQRSRHAWHHELCVHPRAIAARKRVGAP